MDKDEFMTKVIKKLPLLEKLVLSRGIFRKEWLGALLEHCPRLELLDASGCVTMSAIGIRLVERCKSRDQGAPDATAGRRLQLLRRSCSEICR
jgi:hypothetical protein